MSKVRLEVAAELLVAVRFQMEVEETTTLVETSAQARAAAERVAQNVIGLRSDSATAQVQRVTSFTTKLLS
jgi:hypothetical protein